MKMRYSTAACVVTLGLIGVVGIVGLTHDDAPESSSTPRSRASSAFEQSPPTRERTRPHSDAAEARPLTAADIPRESGATKAAAPSEAVLAARVSELTLQANRLQESFSALGRERQVALSKHDDAAASLLFTSMMALAAKRRELSTALTEAGFELSCLRVDGCNEATRQAFLWSQKQNARPHVRSGIEHVNSQHVDSK